MVGKDTEDLTWWQKAVFVGVFVGGMVGFLAMTAGFWYGLYLFIRWYSHTFFNLGVWLYS